MATGGFRSNATTDFLEEWKAKREKMRAKMLGDIAAATGVCTGSVSTTTSHGTNSNKTEARNTTPPTEFNNNGNPDRGSSGPVNCVSSYPMARSSSSSALRRPEDDPHPAPTARGTDISGGNLKKAPQQEKAPCTPQTDTSPTACNDSEKESPTPSKGKERKSSGPSARKGKGQIEKRKLREKRRSTGVVSIPSNESLDELDDDDGAEKDRQSEEALTQLNTVQNEAMTSELGAGHLLQDTPRTGGGRQKSSASPGSEEETGGSRHRQGHSRHGRETGFAAPTGLERRIEELEKELALERQETARLLKAHQDKDELILKLREEIELLNRDLDDIEDENEQLKQENKTLLKVVGQLTR
ncbi:PRKC apoptosis WT1 regulator protein [Chanos chanos]|uniref:PRKC apoptosis WT1 regulator protein n=1 Tax=Chanos chanos TaxID=29144 RepID=A0A6J2W550_CHACN|nr:PRKC apoptosis WT1 regulator protein [Chanos chanos]